MTMTDEKVSTKAVLVLDPGTDATKLANVALFASADNARPVLTCVAFEITTDEIRIVATDSYILGFETLTPADTLPGVPNIFLVPAKDVANWAKMLGKVRSGVATITFGEFTATYEDGQTSQTVQLYPATFPDYRGLFPTEEAVPTPAIGLRADLLARIAKVKNSERPTDKQVPIRFELHGALKVVVGKMGTLTFLQMPVKLAS